MLAAGSLKTKAPSYNHLLNSIRSKTSKVLDSIRGSAANNGETTVTIQAQRMSDDLTDVALQFFSDH